MGSTVHALACALLCVAGCGGPLASARADNARLTTSVTELRANARRDKRRIHELENELVLLKDKLVRGGGELPPLPVEIMTPSASAYARDDARDDDRPGPGAAPPAADRDPSLADLGDDAEVVGIAEDGTAIVYVGDAAKRKPGTLSGDDLQPDRLPSSGRALLSRREPAPGRGPDHAAPERTAARATLRAAGRAPISDDATDRYQQAIAALRAGDHASAITQLRALIARYPRHELADNAQYWLGEAFYDQKDYPHAAVEFQKAATLYPHGNKVPDAMLKLGFSYLAAGQADDGRRALEQVVSVFPRSAPARLAAARLESLGQGGSP